MKPFEIRRINEVAHIHTIYLETQRLYRIGALVRIQGDLVGALI